MLITIKIADNKSQSMLMFLTVLSLKGVVVASYFLILTKAGDVGQAVGERPVIIKYSHKFIEVPNIGSSKFLMSPPKTRLSCTEFIANSFDCCYYSCTKVVFIVV